MKTLKILIQLFVDIISYIFKIKNEIKLRNYFGRKM